MSENHSISYRPITRRDYPALERFIDRLSPGRCPADAAAMHLNRLCLYDNLCQSTYAKAAVLGPRIAGLILGRLCKSRGLYPAFLRRARSQAALLLSNRGRRCYNAYRLFNQTDWQMLYNCAEAFEGELLFIAVAPELRHQGIGLTLLSSFHKYMLSQNVRQIYLFTDSACDFGFYDRQRFDRLGACYWPAQPAKKHFAFYLYKFSYTP